MPHNNSKIKIIALCIIVLSLIAGFIIFNNPFAKKTTILIDADGYSPTNITINNGDVVIFKNSDVRDHWPASNIHPSHAIYPEFDSKKNIPPGKSWSFKFTKAGSWRFHDHLYPQMAGTISVIDSGINLKDSLGLEKLLNPLKILTQKIIPSQNKMALLEDHSLNTILNDNKLLSIYLQEASIQQVMEHLIQESNGGSSFDCHQESHNIGRVGYTIYGEDSFQQCSASCHSGCYHGAMESFLNDRGTDNLAVKIDAICTKFDTSFGLFECLHGVGHGVLAYLDYDLPASIVECQNLKDSFSQSSCYGGLFMENILTGQGLGASTQDHNTAWVNRTDPYFPCNKIDQSYPIQYQCWQMQTSWMLSMASYNFDAVSELCLKAPDNMVSTCFKSMGRDASGHTLRNPEKIISICQKATSKYYNDCLVGALNVIIDFWGPTLEGQATQLCQLLKNPHKSNCYANIMSRISGLFNEISKQQMICNTFEEPYKNQCLSRYN